MEMDLYHLLNRLEEISNHYSCPTGALHRIRKESDTLKICTPMVGLFSSGKSSLLNELLGYSEEGAFLPVDILPETAVPTELEYTESGPEQAVISYYDGDDQHLSLDDFRTVTLDANRAKKAHITLHNSALAKTPDLLLVDMPGFESGFAAHNRAIDGYVENSMAYLIVFSADDGMNLSASMASILKELCQYDKPLIIVITKMDRADDEEAYLSQETRLMESLRECVGNRPLKWCRTSSHDGNIAQFEAQLDQLQAEANQLRLKHVCKMILPVCSALQKHLSTLLKSESLSESELRAEVEKLAQQIANHEKGLQKSEEEFRAKLPECAANISGEVQKALNSAESGVINMVLTNQAAGISDYLNTVVRSTVVNGVQTYYAPVVEKYVQGVTALDMDMSLSIVAAIGGATETGNSSLAGPIAAGIASALFLESGGGLVASGLAAGMGGTVGGLPLVFMAAAGLVKWVSNKLRAGRKREELKGEIRQQLHDQVYPAVMAQVRERLHQRLSAHADGVCEKIKELDKEKNDQLNETLREMQETLQGQEKKKESDMAQLQKDLKDMGAMIHELRDRAGTDTAEGL